MVYISYQDYLKYTKEKACEIHENTEEYIYSDNEENVNNRHDKLFRDLLGYKKEMADFLNEFIEMDYKLTKDDLIKCSTKFVTSNYKDKDADVVYKLKKKNIYFLLEHQTKIDYTMPYRIVEYSMEIIREVTKNKDMKRNDFYPLVVPMVLYTGENKWSAETNFANKQYYESKFLDSRINIKYTLIDINEISNEKLLENNTMISNAMLIEKAKTKEELVNVLHKIVRQTKDEQNIQKLAKILSGLVQSSIGREETEKMLKILNNREVDEMTAVQRVIIGIKNEGRQLGIEEERQRSRHATIVNMIKMNFDSKVISEVTGATEEEINQIRKNSKNS